MTDLQTLSAGELADIPGLQPPPGVEPNFINPESIGYILSSVATVLFSLMLFQIVK